MYEELRKAHLPCLVIAEYRCTGEPQKCEGTRERRTLQYSQGSARCRDPQHSTGYAIHSECDIDTPVMNKGLSPDRASSAKPPTGSTTSSISDAAQVAVSEDDPQGTTADQPYQFSFIDVSSKDARKQARSHVMREFMRAKRGEDEGTAQNTLVRRDSQAPENTRSGVHRNRDSRIPRKKRSLTASLEADREDADDARCRQLVARRSTSSLNSSRSQSPTGPLTGQRDPFQSLPMRLDKEDLGLVDHYITVVPELMCNFKGMRLRSGVTANNFNPTRDIILPQAMNNPITFQATALAFAAGHLARLHGRDDTPNSQKHRMQTLRKLREHFFGQKTHSDDLDILVAVLSLASCEDRFGENTRAWIHMRGCIAMLEKMLQKLDWKKDRRFYTYMNWVLITMTGYDSCAAKILTTSLSRSPRLSFLTIEMEPSNPKVSPEVHQTKQSIHEFVVFLKAIHRLNHLPSRAGPSASPRRDSMFQPGSPLNRLLTSAPGARPGVRSTNIQKACRFACSLYLNAVVLELDSDPENLEEYLKRLGIRIIEQELDWNESTETLMWILLFGDETGDEALRQSVLVWWVGRMTNVAKRLSEQSWMQVSRVMVSCLAKENDSEGTFSEDLGRWENELVLAPLSWCPELVVPKIENG